MIANCRKRKQNSVKVACVAPMKTLIFSVDPWRLPSKLTLQLLHFEENKQKACI